MPQDTPQTYLNQAQEYCRQEQWPQVIAACKQVITFATHQLTASDSAEIRAAPQSLPVTEHQREQIAAPPPPAATSLKLQRYTQLGAQSAQQQDWTAAIAYYQKALKLDPQNVSIHRRLAQLYYQANQLEAAANYWFQALRFQPDQVQATEHFELGQTLLHQGKIEEALVCFQQAIQQEPNQSEFHYGWGQALANQQQWGDAILAYQQALNLQPNVAEIHHDMAEALVHNHQLEQAQMHFQEAIQLNPASAKSYWELAKLWKIQGNLTEEVRCCLKALQSQPTFSQVYIHLRYIRLRYDIPEDSEVLNEVRVWCQQILEQNPSCIWADSLMGYALTKQGQVEAAIPYYQTASYKKAIRSKPGVSPEAWKTAIRKTPDFLIIGGFKCATTSLYQYLIHHPQVLPAVEKELDFFDLQFERGLDWYQAQFPPIPQTADFRTGEATPSYLYCPQAPQRVFDSFPEIKLIVLLRNPIDRAVSHYYFLQRNPRQAQSLDQVIDREARQLQAVIKAGELSLQHLNQHPYLGHSLYVYPLQEWLTRFPSDNVLILQQEALAAQPKTTLSSVFAFLGLPDYPLSEYMRYKQGSYDPINVELRQSLAEFFRPHTQKLEELLGMTLDYNGPQ